jgi:hypothetical protein
MAPPSKAISDEKELEVPGGSVAGFTFTNSIVPISIKTL